jgi:hypothetical protein
VIYIYPNPKDMEKIMWATHKLQSAVLFYGKDEVPRRMAVKAQQEIIAAIVTQKYASRYVPYGTTVGSERYLKWKRIYGTGSGKSAYWQLWGDLLRAITMWKERYAGRHYGYMAGIPKGVMDTGGKSWFTTISKAGATKIGDPKPVAFYARVLEFGGNFGPGGKHHPRPVFTYVLEDFDTGPFSTFLAHKILGAWH